MVMAMAMACGSLYKSMFSLYFRLMPSRVVIAADVVGVVDVIALANWLNDGKSQNGIIVSRLVVDTFHSVIRRMDYRVVCHS